MKHYRFCLSKTLGTAALAFFLAIPFPRAAAAVVVGGDSHSAAILPDGGVLTWGSNIDGRLGDGSPGGSRPYMDHVLSPDSVSMLTGAAAVDAGAAHTAALLKDGGIVCWGDNKNGQLGTGDKRKSALPVRVIDAETGQPLTDITAVACGAAHTLALTADGTVKAWGANNDGQLGGGTRADSSAAVTVLSPDDAGPLTGAVAVAAGFNHSLILLSDHTVVAFGANSRGQLGDASTTASFLPRRVLSADGTQPLGDIAALAAGDRFTVALKTDGTLLSWGCGDDGRLGNGLSSDRSLPGPVLGFGGNGVLSGVVSLSCGQAHTLAVLSDGTCAAFGLNNVGQLGIGTTDNRTAPALVLNQDGTVLYNAVSAGAGDNHSFILREGFKMRAFGGGSRGKLGTGDTAGNSDQLGGSPKSDAKSAKQALTRSFPVLVDSDQDGLCDFWEMVYFGTLDTSPDADPDNDLATNYREYLALTDPTFDDTDPEGDNDNDGMTNGWEKANGLDRDNSADAALDIDGDGLTNLEEFQADTDPNRMDTDFDGLSDAWEIAHGLNPATFTVTDLLGLWSFNEADGTTALDRSPLAAHATLTHVTRAAESADTFVVFNGTDSFAAAPANTSRASDVFTIAFRFRPDTLYGNTVTAPAEDGEMTILELPDTPGGSPVRFYKTARHALAADLDGIIMTTADGALMENRWYHAVLTVNADNTAALYIDAARGDQSPVTASLDGQAVNIGNSSAATTPLQGAVDSVCILSKALTHDQVKDLGDAFNDNDVDGLTTLAEYNAGTDPEKADTDGDGLSDADELRLGTNPLRADTDGDGLNDGDEYEAGTNPFLADSDFDGLSDGWEVEAGLDPLDAPGQLLAWWTFDEAEGDRALDKGAGGFHAALTGTVSAPAVLGRARVFDGLDDNAVTAAAPAFPGDAFTVLARVRFDALYGNTVTGAEQDGTMTVTVLNAADNTALFKLSRTPRHAMAADLLDPATGAALRLESPQGAVLTSRWYQIALLFGDGKVTMLIDGRRATEATTTSTFQWSPETVRFASSGTADDGLLAGAVDNIRFHALRMTAANLDALADTAADTDNDGLSAYAESLLGTSYDNADTDGDGIADGDEIAAANPTDPTNADTDGDMMNDGWELANGFDPLSDADMFLDADNDGLLNFEEALFSTNPHDADTDGDTLSDYDEIYVHKTDPLLADTDGDTQPDNWEIENGTDPLRKDGVADLDDDGLTNEEEYALGTDPLNADTDGDGVSDSEEVLLARTDPLTADFDGTVTTIQTLVATDATNMLGTWEVEGDALVARDTKGWLEYSISLPEADVYKLEVDGTQNNPVTTERYFNLRLFVDGAYAAADVLEAPYGSPGTAVFYLPYLAAGQHTIRVEWRNNALYTSLKINRLRLLSPGGTDWRQNRADALSALDDNAPTISAVSPVCLEGPGYFVDAMKILSGYIPADSPLPVENNQLVNTVIPAPAERWYANIDLDPAAPTPVTLSWQNGMKTQNHSVTWTVTNVMIAEDLTVRTGDALLLDAFPEGETGGYITFAIEGEQLNSTVGNPVVHRFEQAGEYTVGALWTPQSGAPVFKEITVTVKSCSFSGSPIAIVNKERIWDNPGVPNEAVLSYDTGISLVNTPLDPYGRRFAITAWDDKPARILARLGDDGPVMASTDIQSIAYEGGMKSRNYDVIQTFDDGSTLGEMRLVLGTVPPDLVIKIKIIVSGVTFEDGTTQRTVTADDFNELGEYRYRMIKSAETLTSVCHTVSAFQDGVNIGGF
ncbi:MAG: LamG-like jellyroll fold domain-containing protein [Lentisphaeria bacterium]|nr:LamG-like jellyroll fold domain-containing protein [Lentisphaeria bacterium]